MRHIYTFLLIFTFSLQVSFAQTTLEELKQDSAKLYIEYAFYNDYINDSINRFLFHTSLFLGKKGSVYTYQLQKVDEVLQQMEKTIKDEKNKKIIVEEMRKARDWERQLTEIVVKSYDSPNFLSLQKIDTETYWLPDTFVLGWKLVNEFKIIDKYRCQKAIRSVSGLEAIAWFTEQIPISSGPGFLSGLPGLILEYYNPSNKVFYKAFSISSTNIPQQKLREWLVGSIISKSDYNVLVEKSTKNMEQFQKMIKSGKMGNGNRP